MQLHVFGVDAARPQTRRAALAHHGDALVRPQRAMRLARAVEWYYNWPIDRPCGVSYGKEPMMRPGGEIEFGFVAAAVDAPGTPDAQLYREVLADCEHNRWLGYG